MSQDKTPGSEKYARQRRAMVATQMQSRDIVDAAVLKAMAQVPRHEFVPDPLQEFAYHDRPLPIGYDQTISQPYIVALMTQLARPGKKKRALDVGTGSGYQAAVLASLTKEVFSIEILCPLADRARDTLKKLGHGNVTVRCGDGYHGWKEHSPFDLIIVAAAPGHIPSELVAQLAPGGRMVIPVGKMSQNLIVIEKQPDGTTTRDVVIAVRFVPMTGDALK